MTHEPNLRNLRVARSPLSGPLNRWICGFAFGYAQICLRQTSHTRQTLARCFRTHLTGAYPASQRSVQIRQSRTSDMPRPLSEMAIEMFKTNLILWRFDDVRK